MESNTYCRADKSYSIFPKIVKESTLEVSETLDVQAWEEGHHISLSMFGNNRILTYRNQ